MMVQAPEDMGEDSAAPTDSQPLSSKPQKKIPRRKQRKDSGPTEPIPDVATNEEPTSTPSYDPPQSAKTAQAKEIASLKKRVKQLEKRRKSSTSGLKKLRKGRKIANLDADAEVTLIDETQERFDEEMLFDVQDDLQGKEVVAEKEVAKKEVSAADPVTTTSEVVTTASATTTVDELTLAQTLIEIKAAKPKAVTTNAITITTVVASTRPKAKGIIFHDKEEQASAFTPIVSSSQLPQVKDKGKGKMAEEQAKLEKKELHIKKLGKKKILKNWIKQKIDEHVEAKKDDQEEAEMKRHIEIVKICISSVDAIPQATMPLVILFEYEIDKMEECDTLIDKGLWKLKKVFINDKDALIIDREDLETL
ncbi:hypothetical protein Tco_0681192 [Tanacetum coccineum]|uniref:Uncharacterized protein n=1 Tax=Tanacetum coccineum TaxID=301880 RepID=A0ABQ4XML8_9ASTR